jgi:hypothetical protein
MECNPSWVVVEGVTCGIKFDCPEGHVGCWHSIPFVPAFHGEPPAWYKARTTWKRAGNTFNTLTLSPSIRRIPVYKNRDEALAQGALAEHIADELFCALHIYIKNGKIEFLADSK